MGGMWWCMGRRRRGLKEMPRTDLKCCHIIDPRYPNCKKSICAAYCVGLHCTVQLQNTFFRSKNRSVEFFSFLLLFFFLNSFKGLISKLEPEITISSMVYR